jgi:hypothetical protein
MICSRLILGTRWICLVSTIIFIAMAAIPDLAELRKMIARFAPTPLHVDANKLSEDDRRALAKLIEAAYLVDDIFLTQFWSGNHSLYERLKKDTSELGRARLAFFWLNKGPWSALDEHRAFLPGVPEKKPAGSNFYPEDMTKPEFEKWVQTLSPAEKEQAQGFFTTIRRRQGKLVIVPYSQEYQDRLTKLSSLLKDAAALTPNASLKRFLSARAEAFLSNDYYQSDVAWMDLDAPLDVTIGPYETYNDELFGYKAAFEAYITIRDDAETDKLRFFSERLQEIENNLPIKPEYRNPKIGALAPIRVVNEVISTGDAAHGVRTAAFNLPNDERVVKEKGSKRVMLRNVQEAKFNRILVPIAELVLPPADRKYLSFDSFFTHILAHELTHGIGPQQIPVSGTESSPRKELKELYSAIEEAKADVTGLFMLQFMLDRKLLPGAGPDAEQRLYTSFLASSFRTLRFGLNEAHAKGMAIQFNYLEDRGAFVTNPDGTFRIDFSKIKDAVRSLTGELLTIEAEGDYPRAKKMLDELGVLRPNLKNSLDRLQHLPVDINPGHVTASSITPRAQVN